MSEMTLAELVTHGGDVPVLLLIAYFVYKTDKRMERLSARISTFMGMPDDDEHR